MKNLIDDILEDENLKEVMAMVIYEATRMSGTLRDGIMLLMKERLKDAVTPDELEKYFDELPDEEKAKLWDTIEKNIPSKIFKKESQIYDKIMEIARENDLTIEELLKVSVLLLYRVLKYSRYGDISEKINKIDRKEKQKEIDETYIYG